ncbi:MAG TPA: thiamine phosphate synthase [Thermomicrobiales bacterium]|nr:thiamine phosphate synthase [Thermomicrobiales bacterium]
MSEGYRRANPSDVSASLRLYLVADPSLSRSGDIVSDVDAALAGGVSMVQLRAKGLKDRAAFEVGRSLRKQCAQYSVPFLVNDRVDLALALGADGVHLGVDDMPLDAARQVLGPAAIIGWSPETDEQTAMAAGRGADYLGVGPVFGTGSKADAGEPIGLDGLARRVVAAGIPVVAIGGITADTAAGCLQQGASGIAVIGAILRSDDPGQAATALRSAVELAG